MTSSVSTPALYQQKPDVEPSPRGLKKSFSRFSFLLSANDDDDDDGEDKKGEGEEEN